MNKKKAKKALDKIERDLAELAQAKRFKYEGPPPITSGASDEARKPLEEDAAELVKRVEKWAKENDVDLDQLLTADDSTPNP